MNKIWVALITIIITAAVVGGGSYYYLNNKAENEKENLQNQIDEMEDQILDLQSQFLSDESSEESTLEENAIDVDESEWKTYTNIMYDFSLNYPTGWKVDDNLPQSANEVFSPQSNLKISGESDGLYPTLEVWVDADGFGPFFPDYEYSLNVISFGLEFVRPYKYTGESANDDKIFAIASADSTLLKHRYLFHYSYDGDDTSGLEFFEQILSSVSFE